jgi:hypothetical protein
MGDTPVTCTSVVLYKFQAVIHDRCVALLLGVVMTTSRAILHIMKGKTCTQLLT